MEGSTMLSRDEIADGVTFILKLWDTDGTPSQWVETLRGDTARRWYEIYRSSDRETLRVEAADTFHRHVSEVEAEKVRTSRHRCIYIHTDSVKANELGASHGV